MEEEIPTGRWSLGFGLEKVGLVAHRHPLVAAIVLALISVVTVYGMFHVQIDRNLRDMFQGDSESYRTYLEATEDYVDAENQILILVEGDLTAPGALATLRDLQLELSLLDDAGSVYSLFSLFAPPDVAGRMPPLIDDGLDTLTPETIAAVRSHPILGESLVSAAGTAALFAVAHVEPRASLDEHQALIDEIEALLDDMLAGTGMTTTVTGLAAVRTEIVRLLQRDQLVLNGAGVLCGFVLSFLFFRSWVASLMTAVPAALGGLTLIGWTGALGIPVTIVSNIVPILIMVLGYADGMHITSAWRRARDRGLSPREAEREALLRAAPPCMLTALTMAVAFLSMTISDIAMVRDFGWTGAVGCIIGTWIVLAGHAVTSIVLGRFWKETATTDRTPLGWLAAPIVALTRLVTRFAWPIAIASVPLTVICGYLFLSVPADHSVRETLPSSSPSAQALTVIDEDLGGAFPVQVIVPMNGVAPSSPEGLERIRAVHQAIRGVEGTRSMLSLWSLAGWLGGDADAAAEDVADLLAQLPEQARMRFVGGEGALVTVNISELNTAATLDVVDRIEAAATAAVPDIVMTGSTVVSAREATRTIDNLNFSLGIAIFAGLALIAIALRSIAIALVALIPNLLPDMATGSLIWFLGDGLQLTTVVALTIAFGIAIDDTIHYINVVFRKRHISDVRERLAETSREVGPVLVATTLVIIAGVGMTVTSGLSTVVMFGVIVIAALVMAMFADLIFLPAIMGGPARRWFTRAAPPGQPDAGQPLVNTPTRSDAEPPQS
ncbi:MAG: MMPL family transporter [Bauldia sp.]|nr:MMPL family transporter [Bauldia sp.]